MVEYPTYCFFNPGIRQSTTLTSSIQHFLEALASIVKQEDVMKYKVVGEEQNYELVSNLNTLNYFEEQEPWFI